MERRDKKITKEVTWERNSNAGLQTDREDISTVELTGMHHEVDIIVAALNMLRGDLIQGRVMGRRQGHIRLDKVENLLSEIESPNYIGEPQVITDKITQ
jgi:hypothetical protein